MTRTEALSSIQTSIDRILQAKGVPPTPVSDDTALLEGQIPIDSLDLAEIVLELQSSTGRDPFESGFVEFRTAGELAALFAV